MACSGYTYSYTEPPFLLIILEKILFSVSINENKPHDLILLPLLGCMELWTVVPKQGIKGVIHYTAENLILFYNRSAIMHRL